MSLGFKVVPLESAIKPHHLLYLFFGSPKCAEAGRLLGSLIAQHPPGRSVPPAVPFQLLPLTIIQKATGI